MLPSFYMPIADHRRGVAYIEEQPNWGGSLKFKVWIRNLCTNIALCSKSAGYCANLARMYMYIL